MTRIGSILFWSVIAAAFIGPGTVTASALAGATYDLKLLWALSFSVLACLLLQEASARLTVVSGKDLGQAPAGPHWWPGARGLTTGKDFWPEVMPVTRWSPRTSGGSSAAWFFSSDGLPSKRSTWDGPPDWNR